VWICKNLLQKITLIGEGSELGKLNEGGGHVSHVAVVIYILLDGTTGLGEVENGMSGTWVALLLVFSNGERKKERKQVSKNHCKSYGVAEFSNVQLLGEIPTCLPRWVPTVRLQDAPPPCLMYLIL